MAALLIILLGTVLIQGSAIVVGSLPTTRRARGVFADEFRAATFTLATLTLAALFGYCVSHYLLAPFKLDYLRTPVLVIGIALIFVGARTVLDGIPGAIRWPDVLAHLTTQVALLGIAVFTATAAESIPEALAYGIGAACGLAVLSTSFAALLERIDTVDVPFVFRGIPIALITAGFMALALMGFAGMIRN